MAYQIDNKVLQGNQSLDKVWSSELGKAYYRSRRRTVYSTATIDSMIDPQAYSGGHLPYGFCVTDGGNTYQVNNYSGTSEAPPHADWDNLGAGVSFTPVSTPADLNAVRHKYGEIPTTGWSASGHSDHTYFLSGWAAANGIGMNEEITVYDSTGNYVTIGGSGLFGFSNDHLYIQVHSDAGVAANDADAFMAYLQANRIYLDFLKRTFGTGTKWAGEYTTTGLAGHYIQVADIDLKFDTQHPDGAYYNAGAGWSPIGFTFTGHYDGGGRVVDGFYTNRQTTARVGLFSRTNGAVFKNIYINGFCGGGHINGLLVGELEHGNNIVENCYAFGQVISIGYNETGGLIGRCQSGSAGSIINCGSVVTLAGGNIVGGLVGDVYSDYTIENSYSMGFIVFSNDGGGLIGRNTGTVANSYYNTETSGQSDTGKGVPKTTAELLVGTPSAGIYTDWDERIWDFSDPTIYPVHKFFGTLGINLPPPTNLDTQVSGSDVVLTWTAPDKQPKGYFAYRSTDNGAWEKLNETMVTSPTYTDTAPSVGTHNYFVTAVYFNKPYNADQETGNSVTTIQVIA